MTCAGREGIKPHSYYAWTKEFMEAGKERLTRDAVRDATQQEVQQLKTGERGTQAVGGGGVPEGLPSQKNGHTDTPRRRTGIRRMSALEKTEALARVDSSSGLPTRKALGELGVPKSTYYRWLRRKDRARARG